MARKIKVSSKIHSADKKLSENVLFAKVDDDLGTMNDRAKIAAFDRIFSLTIEEQAQLFSYRAKRAQALTHAWERLEFDPDEIAQKFGVDDWEEFTQKTRCWLNGHNVDVAKMVSLLTDGHGQQSSKGRRLKAQLDKLLNDEIEKDLIEIIE